MGDGSTRALLQKITAKKIEKARYSNLLTLLPGNVPIQQALEMRTAQALPFTMVYFDINLFKPLNDQLGSSLIPPAMQKSGQRPLLDSAL